MLFPALLQLAILFAFTASWSTLELRTVWTTNMVLSRLVELVFLTWVQVRLILLALAHDPKEEGYIATHPHIGWKFVPSLLLINLLTAFGLLGGSVLFVLPGVWFFFSILFAGFLLVDKNARGFSALQQSFLLVRHRWWPVVGRCALAAVSFLGISLLVSLCASLVFTALFGGDANKTIGDLSRSLVLNGLLSVDALRAYGISQVQSSLIASFATPFLAVAQAILYRSLVDTAPDAEIARS